MPNHENSASESDDSSGPRPFNPVSLTPQPEDENPAVEGEGIHHAHWPFAAQHQPRVTLFRQGPQISIRSRVRNLGGGPHAAPPPAARNPSQEWPQVEGQEIQT